MKKRGFTLAEVLIAMAIVGVVSVIVIPAFQAGATARQRRVAFTKGINSLARAATANYALNNYDYSSTFGFYGEDAVTPISVAATPGGADDGAIIGSNTMSLSGAENRFSDLHRETHSLFHIWQDHLNMRSSRELHNYAVYPSDSTLACASRPAVESVTVKIKNENDVIATIKPDFLAREYWSSSAVQGSGTLTSLCEGRTLENGGINQGRMFMLDDGMVFTYDPAQAYCLETNPCYGYIDINGPEGPNRQVACSEGQDSFITTYGRNARPGVLKALCTVKSRDVTDIYPVLFYGQNVKPASWAAKSVFHNARSNQVVTPTGG